MNALAVDQPISSPVRIAIQQQRTSFAPGEQLSGAVGWNLERAPKTAEVRLFWYTEGKGTRDVGVINSVLFQAPAANDERSFSFVLPDAPYSFSGRLITLLWAVEVIIEPGGLVERAQFTLSPTGEEIRLSQQAN